MPAYVTHGSYDPVIPVGFGRKARDLLEEGGLAVTYRETRMQHGIDHAVIPEIRDWVVLGDHGRARHRGSALRALAGYCGGHGAPSGTRNGTFGVAIPGTTAPALAIL